MCWRCKDGEVASTEKPVNRSGTVPMEVRGLAVACVKAAKRIEAQHRVIEDNEKMLTAMGYPDMAALLAAIEDEERAKEPKT